MDLVNDFKEQIFKHGRALGLEFKKRNDRSVIRIINYFRKIGFNTKKRVEWAREASIPPKYRKRVNGILERISRGESIAPYLSTRTLNLDLEPDGMFNDWNILHLHLGTKPYDKDRRFVARTGELLFVVMTSDAIKVLGLYSHGSWAKNELLQIIHNNWPKLLICLPEDISLAETITDNERGLLLSAGGFVIDQVKDKKTGKIRLVISETMGISSSRDSNLDVRIFDDIHNELKELEFEIMKSLPFEEAYRVKLFYDNGVWILFNPVGNSILWHDKFIRLP